jgi:type II secretory pathway component GspD/PulD (secretin)
MTTLSERRAQIRDEASGVVHSLDVLPTVRADGYTIHLSLVVSQAETSGKDPTRTLMPFKASARVNVWDGQSVLLGGPTSERVQKMVDSVAFWGDLPLVGRLFRRESSASQKMHLLVFVTPTIIDPAGNPVHAVDNLPYDPNIVPPQSPPE